MDWSKTKTIFIIVFSILNVFLFTLYLNRYTEGQNIEVLSSTTVEERLAIDNINVSKASSVMVEDAYYVSGSVHKFESQEIEKLENQTIEFKPESQIVGTFIEPLPITEENKLEKLVQDNIIKGSSYGLWKIDEENRNATFFQKVNDRLVYYNQKARLVVYWNEENELVRYEQTMLDNLEDYSESKNLLPTIQAMSNLYSKGLLVANSTVTDISLGYSTLVQQADTQVFAPTWRILVEREDGKIDEHFVNAVEGRIIEIPTEEDSSAVK
ncbi:two-component system regulatory protein YycI [Psychrobacillus sp. FSL K6-2684]|uniref:two-component system regulatory protein YycI n=1 Tax=Psychrobacillus sp. FSL K6-2684 TaxID=2921547 RepID=UPI0030F7D669